MTSTQERVERYSNTDGPDVNLLMDQRTDHRSAHILYDRTLQLVVATWECTCAHGVGLSDNPSLGVARHKELFHSGVI